MNAYDLNGAAVAELSKFSSSVSDSSKFLIRNTGRRFPGSHVLKKSLYFINQILVIIKKMMFSVKPNEIKKENKEIKAKKKY